MSNEIGQAGQRGTKPPLPTAGDSVTGGGPLPGAGSVQPTTPTPAQPLPGAAANDPAASTAGGTDPATSGANGVQGGGPLEMISGLTKSKWTGPIMAAVGAGIAMKFKAKPEMVNNALTMNKGKPFLMWSGIGTAASGLYLTGQTFGSAGKLSPTTMGAPGTTNTGTAGVLPDGTTVPADPKAAYEAGIQAGGNATKEYVEKAIAEGRLIDNTAGGAAPGTTPGATPGTPGTGAGNANGSLTDNLGMGPAATPTAPTPTVDPATGQPTTTPTVDPATGQPTTTPTIDPATGQPTTGSTPPATSGTAAAIPAANWTAGALLGQSVSAGEGRSANGSVVAEPGQFILRTVIGEAGGYATFEEANSTARSGMSSNIMGTKLHRWVVLSHGGRFYAFDATFDDGKASPAPKLPSENGTVVGWSALRFVDGSWTSYQHREGGQPSVTPFADVAAGAVATTTSSTSGGAAPGTTPVPGAQPTTPVPGQQAQPRPTTGGGPTATAPSTTAPATPAAPVSPVAGLVGKGFAINAAQVGSSRVAGGWLQIQKVEALGQGVATPAEAAEAIRDLKRGTLRPDSWQRWVTMRGNDGKYYVLQGSIVNKQTPPIDSGAAPMHVFGHGFAEYYDGTAWQAAADVA